MKPASRPKTLTGCLSLRLTPEEEKLITEAAEREGISRSQWLRQAVLGALSCPPEARLLLAEVMAVRALMLALHSAAVPGSDQLIKAAVAHADATRYAAADNRIKAGKEQAA